MWIRKDDPQELWRKVNFSKAFLVFKKPFVSVEPENYVSEGEDEIWDKELWRIIVNPVQHASKMRRMMHDIVKFIDSCEKKALILKFKVLLEV